MTTNWIDQLGQKLIESVKVGGVVISNLTGDNKAITEHIDCCKEECFICKYLGKEMSCVDFQYMYGNVHKKEKDRWVCYQGNFIINEIYFAYTDMMLQSCKSNKN